MRTPMPLVLLAALACTGADENPDTDSATTLSVSLEHTGSVYAFVGAGNLPALAPGDSYAFEVDAGLGQRLSFAVGLDQSNDWFAGAGSEGIPLWSEDRSPVEGELNEALNLWDAGTESDAPLGEGPDQNARQSATNQGAVDDDTAVRIVDTYTVQDWLSVTSTYLGDERFEITFTNTSVPFGSDSDFGPVDLSWMPGAWVVHHGDEHDGLWPLFTNGQTAPAGLEQLAEDADATEMILWADTEVGITVPLGGVFWIVTNESTPLYQEGQPNLGRGLENLCEDGAPANLFAHWESGDATSFGLQDAPDGVYTPAPVLPGDKFLFDVKAQPGDSLHLAWMYVESNDICFALSDAGLPLFDGDQPISGVHTGLRLIDAGTEVNQVPGLGDTQAPRQTEKNTGPDENGNVREVDDGLDYGVADDLVRLTIQ